MEFFLVYDPDGQCHHKGYGIAGRQGCPHSVDSQERRQDHQQRQEEQQLKKERKIQETMLDIKRRFGKNAILRGTNFEEGATAKERNQQIGGHKA